MVKKCVSIFWSAVRRLTCSRAQVRPEHAHPLGRQPTRLPHENHRAAVECAHSLCSGNVSLTASTAWLNKRQVSRLVLAIIEKDSRETVERWQFDITLDDIPSPASLDKENQPFVVPCSAQSRKLPTSSTGRSLMEQQRRRRRRQRRSR